MINLNASAEAPSADLCCKPKRSYQPPRLRRLGDVSRLTETGSMAGMEDGITNSFCAPAWWPGSLGGPANMTFNMC